jgi:hypothetical protein
MLTANTQKSTESSPKKLSIMAIQHKPTSPPERTSLSAKPETKVPTREENAVKNFLRDYTKCECECEDQYPEWSVD